MADALKKIEDYLTCTICQDTYTDPKILNCNHVFCRRCLINLLSLSDSDQEYLKCPSCREETTLDSDVGDLQDAFRTSQILDIISENKRRKLDENLCPQHPHRELELYCEECKDRICFQCIMEQQQHHGHKYNLISEILKPAEEQLMALKDTLKKIVDISGQIKYKRNTIHTEIVESSTELRNIIENRHDDLANKLDGITEEKYKELVSLESQVKATQEKLKQRLELLKKDIGNREKSLVDEVMKITTEFGPEIIVEPSTEADMKFSSSDAASEACDAHGFVSAPKLPEPSQCHAISEVPNIVTVGEKYTTLIQVNSLEGKPPEKSIQSLECVLVSDITGDCAKGSAERNGPSQYEVSYQPTIKGRHHLLITAMSEHIKGSPYSVVAKSSVDKLGTVIKSFLLMDHLGITVNLSGEVVIVRSCGSRSNISIRNLYGDKTDRATHNAQRSRYFGKYMPYASVPSEPSQPSTSKPPVSIQPSGVTIDGEGNIYLANSKRQKHKVQKFTAKGEFLAEVGTEGSRDLQFNQVRGITFNASNNKIYVVDENHHVQVLNSDLSFFTSFGKFGRQEEEFASPSAIACDSTGNVYVADSGNNRIQVFTSAGEFLRMFRSRGEGRGELNTPMGIALDVDGNIYVSEGNSHRVSVFTSEGHFVTSIGQEGEGTGELTRPCGLAVDSSGVVYVCDRDNRRVQLF